MVCCNKSLINTHSCMYVRFIRTCVREFMLRACVHVLACACVHVCICACVRVRVRAYTLNLLASRLKNACLLNLYGFVQIFVNVFAQQHLFLFVIINVISQT